MLQPIEVLKKYWGYHSFRSGQDEIIQSIVNHREVLAILPTGAGKSLCFQVPALCMDGVLLVISPLISLMEDQVNRLLQLDIPAAYLSAGMAQNHIINILHKTVEGSIKILYLSPERLSSELFQDYLVQMQLSFVAIDEAHCIAQWGHDFRPDYLNISLIKQIHPKVKFAAFTASANKRVVDELMEYLQLVDPFFVRKSVVRTNLFYEVKNEANKVLGILNDLSSAPNGNKIVYCRSRKRTEEFAHILNNNNIKPSYYYHAGLSREARSKAQLEWFNNDNANIVATTAFGMGIDKPNVRLVQHWDVPFSLEEYYQEAGRAGRDGLPATAKLYFNENDFGLLHFAVHTQFPNLDFIKNVYYRVLKFSFEQSNDNQLNIIQFDAVNFSKQNNLPINETISAIKIIEREGYWQWQNDSFTETMVTFTTDRETLDYLKNAQPALFSLANALLRHYESVFHFTTQINEYDLAKWLNTNVENIKSALSRLAAFGVIHYKPALRGSLLFWNENIDVDQPFIINKNRYNKLKKAFQERISAVENYLKNQTECRNILLANYFGENLTTKCGKCDNCIRSSYKDNTYKNIDINIIEFFEQNNSASINDLQKQFDTIPKSELLNILKTLEQRDIIIFDIITQLFIKK